MCFSATASFVAAAGLLAAGLVAVRRVRRVQELPLALIPALFGLQQLVEGGVWLTLTHDAAQYNSCLTNVFSGFSQVLWPVLVPLAVLLVEAVPWRRTVLVAFVAAGVAVAFFLGVAMVREPVVSLLQGGHIVYVFPHARVGPATALYLLGVCVAPLLSSHRALRFFGLAATLSMFGAYAVYSTWFISVWCFFAAAMSGIVLMHFAPRAAPNTASPRLVLHPPVPADYSQHTPPGLQSVHVPSSSEGPFFQPVSQPHKDSP